MTNKEEYAIIEYNKNFFPKNFDPIVNNEKSIIGLEIAFSKSVKAIKHMALIMNKASILLEVKPFRPLPESCILKRVQKFPIRPL